MEFLVQVVEMLFHYNKRINIILLKNTDFRGNGSQITKTGKCMPQMTIIESY